MAGFVPAIGSSFLGGQAQPAQAESLMSVPFGGSWTVSRRGSTAKQGRNWLLIRPRFVPVSQRLILAASPFPVQVQS